MSRGLCIVLHDVAPATWERCERLLAMLDEIAATPVTLLVVPDFHGHGRIDAAPEFLRAIERRVARGDEVALHGYFHRDDAPAPRSPLAWLRRRVLTAGEGEFAELGADGAETRLRLGLNLFARLGWQVAGFVAPAWLASGGTREALRRVELNWTSTHAALLDLARDRRIVAPCLTASPRSNWRRRASVAWLSIGARAVDRFALVRAGLHPGDADHAELVACWRATIVRLLARRKALTKSQAIAARVASAVASAPMPEVADARAWRVRAPAARGNGFALHDIGLHDIGPHNIRPDGSSFR
jgi:predicted deacetylase